MRRDALAPRRLALRRRDPGAGAVTPADKRTVMPIVKVGLNFTRGSRSGAR